MSGSGPNVTRGFIPILVLVGVIVVAGIAWWIFQGQNNVSTATTAPSSRLAADLANVMPQFVANTTGANGDVVPPPQLAQIKQDVAAILIPGETTGSLVDVQLNAVGKRYVAASIVHPTDGVPEPQIVDAQMSKVVGAIPGLLQFTQGDIAVYLTAGDICTYKLDTSSCVPLGGAKLSGGEVYGDDQGLAGVFAAQDETHTAASLSIAVLHWVPDPQTGYNKLVKVREASYQLPE